MDEHELGGPEIYSCTSAMCKFIYENKWFIPRDQINSTKMSTMSAFLLIFLYFFLGVKENVLG